MNVYICIYIYIYISKYLKNILIIGIYIKENEDSQNKNVMIAK